MNTMVDDLKDWLLWHEKRIALDADNYGRYRTLFVAAIGREPQV